MTSQQLDQIRHLASRYIWWQSPEEVMSQPDRLIAQIMNLGDYADVQYMVNAIGTGPFLKLSPVRKPDNLILVLGTIGIIGLD